MTWRPITILRRSSSVAFLAVVVLSIVAALTFTAGPAVADGWSLAGTGVAALDLVQPESVGPTGHVDAGQGRETAPGSYDFASGCCVATKGPIWLDPNELNFSQRTAGGGDPPRAPGLRDLLAGGWDPSKGAIDVIATSGGLVTFDNTRVAIAQELGLEGVTANVHQLDELLPEGFAKQRGLDSQAKKLGVPTPSTWGDALTIRAQRNRLPVEGTATRPRMPC